MDKTENLLRMTDNPEQYSDKEWQELLADEECRELYEAMHLSAGAFEMEDGKIRLADGLKEQEWQRFEKEHFSHRPWGWMQIAATIIGVLMLSGITYATIHIIRHAEDEVRSVNKETQVTDQTQPQAIQSEVVADSIPPIRIFENIPLDEIVKELALYYNKVTDIQSNQAHEVRLYYKWEKMDGLEGVVSDLNHFDHVNLAIEDDKLIVKP